MPDILITGLPRCGLTAVAALVDYLPNAVCLNAPRWQLRQAHNYESAVPYCKWLAGDFLWQRMQLSRQNPVPDFRAGDGSPLLDQINDQRAIKTASGNIASIPFTRPKLEKDFILGMKHHALYTAVLPELVQFEHFRIIAVIRHPLDVILSWRKFPNRPFGQGKLPAGTDFWPEGKRIGESGGSVLTRMVRMYDLFCQRYHELREHIHIVKYEDIMADPMEISRLLGVSTLSAAAPMLTRPQRIRVREEADEIKNALKESVFAREFYEI